MTDEITRLLKRHQLASDQVDEHEVRLVLQALVGALTLDGAVVEFGCYAGTTSLFISRILQQSPREFHVYDSFEGLPEKLPADKSVMGEQFRAGELTASKKQFVENYKKANLPLPTIHKGWFEDLSQDDVPKKIAFAFLDGDYYSSIKTSLALITPRLVRGATIVVDDYMNQALPGAARAVDEWRAIHQSSLRVEHSLAIIRFDN